jgi:hypothetical protein
MYSFRLQVINNDVFNIYIDFVTTYFSVLSFCSNKTLHLSCSALFSIAVVYFFPASACQRE